MVRLIPVPPSETPDALDAATVFTDRDERAAPLVHATRP